MDRQATLSGDEGLWSPIIKLSLVRSHRFNSCLHVSFPVSSPPFILFGTSEEASSFSQGWRLRRRLQMWIWPHSTHRAEQAPLSTSRGQLQGLTLIQTIKFKRSRKNSLLTPRKFISGCTSRTISGLRGYADKPQARAVRIQTPVLAPNTCLTSRAEDARYDGCGREMLHRADRSTSRDTEIHPDVFKQLAQGLTAVSSGKIKVISVMQGCIMKISAWKHEIFVESLLRLIGRQKRDSVHACCLEQGLANLSCSKYFRLGHPFCCNYSTLPL